MKPSQISKILKLCRQNYVKSIKIEGIEIEFEKVAEPEQPILQATSTQTQAASIPALRSLSEDEMQYWSTPFFDQVIQERQKDQTA